MTCPIGYGSKKGYDYGCRCPACKADKKRVQNAWKLIPLRHLQNKGSWTK